jgi:hypothetical protein
MYSYNTIPLAELAAKHGVKLVSIEELPPSYENSLRVWLNHRIATLAGVHKRRWEEVKGEPDRLQRAREANRARARAYRERKRSRKPAQTTCGN